jgi:hypothetical protein
MMDSAGGRIIFDTVTMNDSKCRDLLQMFIVDKVQSRTILTNFDRGQKNRNVVPVRHYPPPPPPPPWGWIRFNYGTALATFQDRMFMRIKSRNEIQNLRSKAMQCHGRDHRGQTSRSNQKTILMLHINNYSLDVFTDHYHRCQRHNSLALR